MIKDYEMVIGLEVHCELNTKTKIFCDCPTTFGAEPNTQVCPVCLGMPGTLPVLNEEVVNGAIKAGLATNCKISKFSKQDRKNYFYPDLPKAYQISQYDLPLCYEGELEIETDKGTKKIGITRIHIEEDAGKLVHDEKQGTMIDCNRCGVPLIEIVSEPDIRSAQEAVAYFKKLRAILLYTGISDCKMNEGSLRCDVNLSVRKVGAEKFGTRTEMKNLNSFQFILKAIEFEYKRQIELVEKGEEVIQETRRFDQNSGKTFSMRKKEDANDYRYFPDPDLAPIITSDEKLNKISSDIPMLPDARKEVYVTKYGLTSYDAEIITNDMGIANYFELAANETSHKKVLANILIGDVLRILDGEDAKPQISEKAIGEIAELVGAAYINSSVAKKLVKDLWGKADTVSVKQYVDDNDMAQISDRAVLEAYAKAVIEKAPKLVSDYKSGKLNAFKAIVGQVMAKSAGKANPVMVNDIITELINEN